MKAQAFEHQSVNEDGSCPECGHVHTEGYIVESEPDGGCGTEGCTNCDPGHWFTLVMPMDLHKRVCGIYIKFDSKQEKDVFLDVIKEYFGVDAEVSDLKYANLHLQAELDKNTEYMTEAMAKISEFEKNLKVVQGKITEHWLETAFERWKAGESEENILADFGYVKKP